MYTQEMWVFMFVRVSSSVNKEKKERRRNKLVRREREEEEKGWERRVRERDDKRIIMRETKRWRNAEHVNVAILGSSLIVSAHLKEPRLLCHYPQPLVGVHHNGD